ncbi:MAG: hypothetical protein QF435_14315 [Arenicellales bacterium]|nr:hypothetical protein [Arenicellales bacterium]
MSHGLGQRLHVLNVREGVRDMVYRIAGWDALAFLEGPFHDAAAAIHQRMHQLGIPH